MDWLLATRTFGEYTVLVLDEDVTSWYVLTTERTDAEGCLLYGHEGREVVERVTILDSLIYEEVRVLLKRSATRVEVLL